MTPDDDPARRARFDRLVGGFRDDLIRYAFWLGRDAALAEDVVQESMLRAWRSLESLREDEAAKTWLLTIVRREFARHFERKRLETRDVDELTLTEEALIAVEDDTDLGDLRQAIFRLEDDYREPLVMQVLFGYSTQEIANVMGLQQGAVLTRLHRARQKLIDSVDM